MDAIGRPTGDTACANDTTAPGHARSKAVLRALSTSMRRMRDGWCSSNLGPLEMRMFEAQDVASALRK